MPQIQIEALIEINYKYELEAIRKCKPLPRQMADAQNSQIPVIWISLMD